MRLSTKDSSEDCGVVRILMTPTTMTLRPSEYRIDDEICNFSDCKDCPERINSASATSSLDEDRTSILLITIFLRSQLGYCWSKARNFLFSWVILLSTALITIAGTCRWFIHSKGRLMLFRLG